MKITRRLLTAAMAGVLLLSACGSDDNDESTPTEAPAVAGSDASPPTEPEPADDMTDDDMTDDDMTDDDKTDDGTAVLVDELTAAGLTADQARCVVDAAAAEWGADALLAAGSASDEQLVRLAEITFDCAV